MELKSLSAPALGEAGLKRLFAFTTPKRFGPDSTQFDMGYEQAKKDFYERLVQEVGNPTDEVKEPVKVPRTMGEKLRDLLVW